MELISIYETRNLKDFEANSLIGNSRLLYNGDIKWTDQVERRSVEVGVLLAEKPGVEVLEDLVEAELADALHGVADGSRGPAEEQVLGAALLEGQLEAVAQALVLLLVHLRTKDRQET